MGQKNSKFAKKNDIMKEQQIIGLTEQIAKLEEEKRGLKERMAKTEEEKQELKERMAKTEEEKQELKERMAKIEEENRELKERVAKKEEEKQELKERMAKTEEENRELKERVAKKEEENRQLKERVAKKEAYIKEIRRRPMPAELKYEMFDSMPLENAFSLLASMSNGLLARNVRNRINGTKKAMKNNKWKNCGPLSTITEDGLVLTMTYSGPHPYYRINSVRAALPIPSFMKGFINKPTIAFYFEVQILNNTDRYGSIGIGLCDQQFPLEGKWIGEKNAFIGIWHKHAIWIDGSYNRFGEFTGHIKKGNVLGLGIIHQPNAKMELFFTCDGKFVGKTELPPKYANIQLYPAVTLFSAGQSILANFGKEEWQFKEFERVLE